MLGFAKSMIMGNVVRAPELKTTTTGKKVASFTVAVNSKGNKGEADFYSCVAWEKTAEILAQYLEKGKPIYVEGVLNNRSYEIDGVKRQVTELNVRDFYFLGNNQDVNVNAMSGPITKNQVLEKAGDFVVQDFDDRLLSLDDIPF